MIWGVQRYIDQQLFFLTRYRKYQERRKAEEDAIEELRKEAQAMRRTGNPEWLSMHARMRALMDRGREAKKDPRVEAWRREASELRMKAREAKAKGDVAWKDSHTKIKKV